MKKSIVILMTTALVALLVVGGTMAWFTAEAEATNSFKAGTLTINLVDEFDEEEAQNVNPGDCYDKTVYVENTGTKRAYIRVKLTPKFDPNNLSTDVVTYLVDDWEKNWALIDGWYYYRGEVDAKTGETTKLIEKVCFDGEGMGNDYQDASFTLEVKAEAIQVTNGAINAEWGIDPENWEKIQ